MKTAAEVLQKRKEKAERAIAAHAERLAECPLQAMNTCKPAIRSSVEAGLILNALEVIKQKGHVGLMSYAQRQLASRALHVAPSSSCPIDNLMRCYEVEFWAWLIDELQFVDA